MHTNYLNSFFENPASPQMIYSKKPVWIIKSVLLNRYYLENIMEIFAKLILNFTGTYLYEKTEKANAYGFLEKVGTNISVGLCLPGIESL